MPLSKRHFFDFLFRQHRQELLAFAGRHSNHEAAEDLVQEAYLRFIQHAETGHIENPAPICTVSRITSAPTITATDKSASAMPATKKKSTVPPVRSRDPKRRSARCFVCNAA
ncbi:MAG: RNA polymerase sigma factor [Gammaproteobacteria bacterium]